MQQDILESMEFYDLMQSYRHCSIDKQQKTLERYEDVKQFIRSNFIQKTEIPIQSFKLLLSEDNIKLYDSIEKFMEENEVDLLRITKDIIIEDDTKKFPRERTYPPTAEKLVTQDTCQTCTNPAKELHTCPFKVDIHDDIESLCNCCNECEHQCALDI